MDESDDAPAKWQDELYDLLRRNNVTQFAYVPDAGHRLLIDRSLADPQAHSVALTTEEEGVALLAGADLGGARPVLLVQSSGTGNCINMLSLIRCWSRRDEPRRRGADPRRGAYLYDGGRHGWRFNDRPRPRARSIRKSSCRPIRAGTASRRSSMKSDATAADTSVAMRHLLRIASRRAVSASAAPRPRDRSGIPSSKRR